MAHNVFPKTYENKRQNRTPSIAEPATVEQETQSVESVDFTTATWKEKLQEKSKKPDRLNVTIAKKNTNRTRFQNQSLI